MNKLLEKLRSKKFCLIASLPENSYELAKIAWEAGVDAIKVHVNVYHNASKNQFASLAESKELLTRIIKDCPVPVGIVAGGDPFYSEQIMDELVKMGLDFVSLFAHHTSASFYLKHDINNFLSINSSYSFEEIKYLANSGFADILEMSIIDKEEYGQRLNARDLAKYKYIASLTKTPTVVPTQKMIYAADIPTLYKTGVKGVMAGAVVYGNKPEVIRETLINFRKEIDKL